MAQAIRDYQQASFWLTTPGLSRDTRAVWLRIKAEAVAIIAWGD